MRVDVLIIVSNVAVNWLMGASTGNVVLNNIDIDVLVDVNVNVFAGGIISFEFDTPGPLAKCCC